MQQKYSYMICIHASANTLKVLTLLKSSNASRSRFETASSAGKRET